MIKSNNSVLFLLASIFILLIFSDCKDDEGSELEPTKIESITSLSVSDIGDAGNGADLQISFSRIADESQIEEYQIFVVESTESTDFNLEKAENISTDNLFTLTKTGNDISINLLASSKTVNGVSITNDIPYRIFVMSVTADPMLFANALSVASEQITLIDNSGPPTVESVSNLLVQDTGNEGSGLDMQVSFSRSTDESIISEYRIMVVNSEESDAFNVEAAANISSENFTTVAKTGNDISINLAADSKTVTGELITEDVAYKVFVMTVAADATQYLNALSNPSEEISLSSVEKVKVTFIANDGIMIEFEDKKVVIDAINRASNLGGWISPSSSELMALENGEPPYDDIDIIMITHNHGDHYHTAAVANYLSNHPETKLIATSDVEPNFSAFTDQIVDFEIEKFERITTVQNGITIDVLEVEHFDQFGNIFDDDESYAYNIHLGGKRFLHVGDLDYLDSQLEGFDLLSDDITVVFIPTFGDLVSAANRDALIENVEPENIVCLHFLTSSLSTTLAQINNIYPGADAFTTPFETREY